MEEVQYQDTMEIESTELNLSTQEESEASQEVILKAIRKCSEWYEKDKNAKQFYVDEMKEMYKLYSSKHWDLFDPTGNPLRTEEQQRNRPNSVENITFALIEGTASEFTEDIELIDFPVEQGDDDQAKIMTDLKEFIFYKNTLDMERIKYLRWFFLYGTGIWHIYWDPDWRGGRGPNRWEGDIRWKALHPLMLIPDARCKEDINEGNRCHKRVWRTLEELQQKYPHLADQLQEETMDETDDMLLDMQTDAEGFDDSAYKEDQLPVIETWYVGEPLIPDESDQTGYGLHVIWWAGENQQIYLKHTNYIYFDPEETTKFPFIVRQCYPRENSIWGYGEAYFLKNPQIIRNKTAEIIIEGHMHQAVGQTYYDQSALSPKQKRIVQTKGTLPGMWFEVQNINGIKREYSKNIPSTLLTEMDRNRSVMESIIGRFDISQGRTPGSITAFKAIAELSARAQVRLRIKEKAIESSYEEGGMYVNRLIEKFYTERRKFRIMGKDKNKNNNANPNSNSNGYQYGEYNPENMLKVYDTTTGTVVPYAQAEEQIPTMGMIKQLKQQYEAGMISEEEYAAMASELQIENYEIYFPEFDCYCKTSSVTPSDRFYYIEVAKELLTAGILPPKIFLQVLDTGKFPPIEEIIKEIDRMNQPRIGDMLGVLPPELQQYMKTLSPEDFVMEMAGLLQIGAQHVDMSGMPAAMPQEQGGENQRRMA
jgi:hypothetical protein